MAYYVATGSHAKANFFWNRKRRVYQPYACLDCVYPTYQGAARIHASHTSAPARLWREGNRDTSREVFWLLSQKEYEKQVETFA